MTNALTTPAALADAVTEDTTAVLDDYAGKISAIADSVYGAGHPEAADALEEASRIIVGASARILSDLAPRLSPEAFDLIEDQAE